MLYCFRASPYGRAAYPGLFRGFFSSLGAEKMAATAPPIVCRHRPSAAVSLQEWRLAPVTSELPLAYPWGRGRLARGFESY